MGLDVFLVETKYTTLKVTRFPVDDFVRDLSGGPIGMPGRPDYSECPEYNDWWGGGWDNNGIYEFTQSGLDSIARGWATSKKLDPNERRRLRRWVARLPYRDDYVMLHFSY